MYICICKGIKEQDIKQAISKGATTFKMLNNTLGVGTPCGRCCHHLKTLLAQETTKSPRSNDDAH